MKSAHLRDSYELNQPGVWAGTYMTARAQSDSWSWYRGGNSQDTSYPHITVTVAEWETQRGTGEWVGFHVSLPISGGAKNARLNYKISSGVVSLGNVTRTGFTDKALAEANNIYQNKDTMALLLDFATCFYSVAKSYSDIPAESRLRKWLNVQG